MLDGKAKFNSKNTGILLISHGSRLPIASETINKLAEMYREETDFKVGVGYMEIKTPNIPEAMDELVKGTKIDTVIAVPVFLAHGIHTTRDIPKILGLSLDSEDEKSLEHNHNDITDNHHNHHHHHKHHNPHNNNNHEHSHHHHHHEIDKVNFDGRIIYTEPLGADPLVLEIIKNRVDSVLNQ